MRKVCCSAYFVLAVYLLHFLFFGCLISIPLITGAVAVSKIQKKAPNNPVWPVAELLQLTKQECQEDGGNLPCLPPAYCDAARNERQVFNTYVKPKASTVSNSPASNLPLLHFIRVLLI